MLDVVLHPPQPTASCPGSERGPGQSLLTLCRAIGRQAKSRNCLLSRETYETAETWLSGMSVCSSRLVLVMTLSCQCLEHYHVGIRV